MESHLVNSSIVHSRNFHHICLTFIVATQCSAMPHTSFFKPNGEPQICPQPVITTRGLCFAANAKGMNEVFAKSNYIDNFQEVFGIEEQGQLLNGHQTITLQVNTRSKYLTDRNETSGNFW